MLKEVKNNKVVNFKQRHQEFTEWLEEVKKENFSDASKIDSAVMIYVTKDEKGELHATKVHFRMPEVEDFEYIAACLKEYILNWKFENYLKEHIGDFLQYVND